MFFASLLFACLRTTPRTAGSAQIESDPLPSITSVCNVLYEALLAQGKGGRISTGAAPFQSYGAEIPSGTVMGAWQAQHALSSVPLELGLLACSPPPSLPRHSVEDWSDQICQGTEAELFIRVVEVWMNADQAYAEVHMLNGPYLAASVDRASYSTTLRLGLEHVDGLWQVAELERDDHPSRLPQCK